MIICIQKSGNYVGRRWWREKNRSISGKYTGYPYANPWMIVLVSLIVFTLLFPVVRADPEMAQHDGFSSGDECIMWGPYLTNTTHNSTVIHWKTSEPSVGRVDYTFSGVKLSGKSSQRVSENNSSQIHEIHLGNLEPGGRYSYYLVNSSKNYSFRTLPFEGSFTFIVYGDTREQLPLWNQSTHHALVAERIAREPDCLFVVHTGDLVNDPTDEDEWGRFFEAAGPMLANTTFYPVPGNHEGNLSIYQDIFGMPQWYSFQCSDAGFTVVNSNTITPVMASAQDHWMNGTLENKSKWNFVFLHHPLYTSEVNHWGGYTDVQEKWGPVFQAAGVNAVFSAHVHAYEHFYENGIHYFTMGTGGAPFYPLAKQKPEGYRNSMENTLAYARVTVDDKYGSALIEVIKVAEVDNGQIIRYPPGTIAEMVVISQSPGKKSDALNQSFPVIYPLFKIPLRFLT